MPKPTQSELATRVRHTRPTLVSFKKLFGEQSFHPRFSPRMLTVTSPRTLSECFGHTCHPLTLDPLFGAVEM